jgi:hypothetical protein
MQFDRELIELKVPVEGTTDTQSLRDRDELYESAIEIVVRERRGSLSLLQRTLGIGYGRAARLVDFMAEDGIVGQYNGSKSREVLLTMEEWEAIQASGNLDEKLPGNPVAKVAEQFSRSSHNAAPPSPRGRPATIDVDDDSPQSSIAVVASGRRIDVPPEDEFDDDDWDEELEVSD